MLIVAVGHWYTLYKHGEYQRSVRMTQCRFLLQMREQTKNVPEQCVKGTQRAVRNTKDAAVHIIALSSFLESPKPTVWLRGVAYISLGTDTGV